MRIIISIVLLFIAILPGSATPQLPDMIEYDDKVFEFGVDFESPLYSFPQKDRAKWPKEFPSKGFLSNLQRGHIALYRVVQGKLWLVSIEVPVSDEDYDSTLVRLIDDRPYAPFPLTRLFPNCTGAVHASWFTGDLNLTRPPSKAELAIDKSISTRHEILTFKDGILMHSTKSATDSNSSKEKSK